MRCRKQISWKNLIAAIHYDPVEGTFTWLSRKHISANINARIAGKPAGTVNADGYLVITIDGMHYYAHRLAVFYMTKRFPRKVTDHHDLDPGNNKWVNIRPASKGQNQANRGPNTNSKTGIKGVHPCNSGYRAVFRGEILGYGKTPESIVHLYRNAERKFFGEFSR
jgi:hypothetical protein